MNDARFSFAKTNMNSAIAMGKNDYGHTLLDAAEKIDVSSGANPELEPHIDASGEFRHSQSVLNSPTMQAFLQNYASTIKEASATPVLVREASRLPMVEVEDTMQISDLEEYAKGFDEDELVSAPRPRRAFAPKTLTKFCTECGCGFGETEKFCPHCGHKRTTYMLPTA